MAAITFQELSLRYASECELCRIGLPEGARAVWHPVRKTVRCLRCFDPIPVLGADPFLEPQIDSGVPGASAARMFERRHQESWNKGAEGERLLGRQLEETARLAFSVLHDRAIPLSRTNIDHIAVAATGVFVIDAKKWKGEVSFGLKDGHRRVLIDGRNRTSRVKQTLDRQVGAVSEALEGVHGRECPIIPVMCLVDSEWRELAYPRLVEGFLVTKPVDLICRLNKEGPIVLSVRRTIAAALAERLPPA